jgi:hypothetical protein
MTSVTGHGNGEGVVMGCHHFQRGRRWGGYMVLETDDTTKSGAAAGVWRSKMTKENWIGGSNTRLS